MTFSAVTCLTYTGSTPLGGFINIYSDQDGYTTPFQTGVPLSGFTAPNCPYYIDNVPSGSTTIRLVDIPSYCSADFDLQSNNLCQTCDLNFDVFSSETVSRIVAGNLTGSCTEGTITDYLIHWYETGDTINPSYISGFGSVFTPYSFTHPLTTTSAIIAQEGTYKPIIQKVKVDDLIFSLTGGSGTIPADIEDCFDTTKITVNPLTCDNGEPETNFPYSHKFDFQGQTSGGDAPPLEATFNLSASTNYVPIFFRGESVPDRLTILYNGDEYGEPLVLEDMVVGSSLTATRYNPDIIPKSADTTQFAKILTLTGLTRSPNDSLTIKVTPNEGNSATNWEFQATCLESVDQTTCAISNDPKKIVYSSITWTDQGCTTSKINLGIFICLDNQDTFSKFIRPNLPTTNPTYYSSYTYLPSQYFSSPIRIINYYLTASKRSIETPNLRFTSSVCDTPNTNIISYSKSVNPMTGIGEIGITSNTISDINHYYSKWGDIINSTLISQDQCAAAGTPYSGTPFDPNDPNYYRYFYYAIPDATGNVDCGSDGTGRISTILHFSAEVTTGTTGSDYFMTITMPTIVNNYPYSDESCVSFSGVAQGIVNIINASSTGTTNNFNFTNNKGSKYVQPIYRIRQICTGVTTEHVYNGAGEYKIPTYINQTIPFSGGTIQPSLSGESFTELLDPSVYDWTTINNFGGGHLQKYTWYYRWRLPDPNEPYRFKLYAIPFTGTTTGPEIHILSYTGDTGQKIVYDASYFIGYP